jgi:hypothetical protein
LLHRNATAMASCVSDLEGLQFVATSGGSDLKGHYAPPRQAAATHRGSCSP